MVDATPLLPGLSAVQGKAIVARFDGGRLSSEGGLLALREIERRLGLADRLASCLKDPRAPEKVVHRLAGIIRFRMLMIAAGYEEGNDADALRGDPMFKLALDRLPSDEELCSQSTISRLENLPDIRALLRLGRALIEQYCGSFRQVPKRIVLDIDDTFDRVHGEQQLRLFNAYHDDYGFQLIVVFDGEGRFVTALLRPGKRPGGREIAAFVRRLVGAIRACGPGSRSYCAPTAIMPPPKSSIGAAPTEPIGCSASPPIRHCAVMSLRWRKQPPSASGRRPSAARYGASRNSTMPPTAGAESSASSPGSRQDLRAPTPALSLPISKGAAPSISTRGSTARAAGRRITSRRGNTTLPPTEPPATRPRPTSSACSCTPAPTGCCGRCAA
jgi:hypothetical protein